MAIHEKNTIRGIGARLKELREHLNYSRDRKDGKIEKVFPRVRQQETPVSYNLWSRVSRL
jgi:hypothetical protein